MLLSKHYAGRGPMRLALATMLVLLLFAWHFYLERAAYYDLAYHLFIYLKDKSLFVQNRRFVAIVTQLPTLLALKAGLPLDGVLRLYSVVFIVYYLAVFLVCAYWFRNQQVALVVALLYVLLASRTFYWAQSELPQGLAALLLFYGGVARQAPLPWRFSTLALAALVPVFIFGHPLIILPFLFIWAYDWVLNRRFRDWAYYGMLVLALAMYQLRAMLIPPGSYEATHMTFTPNLIKFFPNYLALGSFHNFWQLCSRSFLALPLLLLALTVFYARQRTWPAWLRLGLVWGFVGGYTFIINVSNPDYTDPTYLENLYLPLTLFVAVPFALELLPALERRWNGRGAALATGLLGVLLLARLALVWQRHVPYTAHQQWLNQLLTYTSQFPERKFIMDFNNMDPHQLRAGGSAWASASETMMVSARQHPDSVQTVRVGTDVEQMAAAGAQPGILLGPFETMNTSDLPARYFRFPNTSYRVLNTLPPSDTASLRPYITAHQGVRLVLPGAVPTTWQAGRQHTLPVLIQVPPAARPLHSGIRAPHPTLLRTAFYKAHDWPTDALPVEVPLEVDVWQPWTQTLPLRAPQQPGHYTFEVSLISKDYRDWPVRLRIPVEVVE
ncbi:hypothetical protein [Hymenobacter sp. DG01]|uniref:hypothetical protein n=1 Tax=Hymenobacter sp. DG01 TaxID=2584940 RepID=UPI00111F97CC|nr:hypothetical protein [Hymenobacter sp. DG01]